MATKNGGPVDIHRVRWPLCFPVLPITKPHASTRKFLYIKLEKSPCDFLGVKQWPASGST